MSHRLQDGRILRNEKGGKFRVLVGAHIDQGPQGCDCDACTVSGGKNHVYKEGDVVDSKLDLDERFNQGPHSRKFERLHEQSQTSQTPSQQPLQPQQEPRSRK